jgi:hypothetical protein
MPRFEYFRFIQKPLERRSSFEGVDVSRNMVKSYMTVRGIMQVHILHHCRSISALCFALKIAHPKFAHVLIGDKELDLQSRLQICPCMIQKIDVYLTHSR